MIETNYYERTKRLYLFSFGKFTLFVYKSLTIIVQNFQKYYWIQHKKMQTVVVTSEPINRT